MDLDPKCIFVQRERNLDVHHPVIKLVASLARNRGVTFTEIHRYDVELILRRDKNAGSYPLCRYSMRKANFWGAFPL